MLKQLKKENAELRKINKVLIRQLSAVIRECNHYTVPVNYERNEWQSAKFDLAEDILLDISYATQEEGG